MTVIHVEFDVDGDVHPELHAMLSSIGSDLSRGERFRQLAAAGLIWERIRIEARHPSPLQAPVAQPHAEGPAASPSAADAAEPRRAAPDSGPRAALAVDAPPTPAAPMVDAPAGRDRNVDGAHREIPVLVDVVVPDETLRLTAVPSRPRATPTEAAAGQGIDPPATRASRPSDDVVDIRDWAADEAKHPGQVFALPQSTGVRPRLLRMKQKGLFKNG